MKRRIEELSHCGLMGSYLAQRLNEAPMLGNELMHSVASVGVHQAAEPHTDVRDLWSYLRDKPFELTTPWSMRT